VGAASDSGPVALLSHLLVVPDHGIEDRGKHAAVPGAVPLEAIEDELGDGGVSHQLCPPQDLEVAGDGGLGQIEHRLEIGHEERRGGQAVEDPEPGGLRDGQQQVGSAVRGHMRRAEYKGQRTGRTTREADEADKKRRTTRSGRQEADRVSNQS